MRAGRSLIVVVSAVALVTAALAAVAFGSLAGESRKRIVVPSEEASAGVLLPIAVEAASAWDADAFLVRAFATEGAPVDGRVDPPMIYDTTPDASVGNGLAVVWTFSFAAPSKGSVLRFVSVGGDKSILYDREIPDPEYGCCVAYEHAAHDAYASHPPPGPRAAAFAIGADEAVSKIADREEFRAFADDHPQFQAFLLLHADGERSVWTIAYRTASFFHATAVVDAATGDVAFVDAWPSTRPTPPCCDPHPVSPVPPPPEPYVPADYSAEYSAVLGPSQSSFGVNVPLDSRFYARELRVAVEVEGALVVDEFAFRLVDAEGREIYREKGSGAFEAVVTSFSWEGAYYAELVTARPLAHDVPVTVRASVDYEPGEANAPAADGAFTGEAYAWGGEQWYAIHPDGAPVTGVRLTLSWNRALPTEKLELVLHDDLGNPIARASGDAAAPPGAQSIVLERDVGRVPSFHVTVRSPQPGFTNVPFTLAVEWLPDGAPPAGNG